MSSTHLVLVLLALWITAAYRVSRYLAHVDPAPEVIEPWLYWGNFSLLSLAAVVIPLCRPRRYVPFDLTDPTTVTAQNTEQTASFLSLLLYSFMDGLVLSGYRKGFNTKGNTPLFAVEELPLLADCDWTQNIVAKGFKHVDPFHSPKTVSQKHIFFRLLRTYAWEAVIMCSAQVVRVAAAFAVPIGLYRLLDYLANERDGGAQKETEEPWVWILWMLLGPLVVAMMAQYYTYLGTHVRVQLEALITELVFEHALRSRVTASDGTEDRKRSTSDSHVPTKPQNESNAFLGKLNNLITSDMNTACNIVDLSYPVIYVPIQISLCVWFLFSILGWSALVGMLVALVMFPLPGYITGRLQTLQKARMKKTDARVQSVTEVMNVVRMIKMFAWEDRVEAQIADRREDELILVRRFKFLELANGLLNFAIPALTMISTFITYTVVMKRQLTVSTVFAAIPVFALFRDNLDKIFGQMGMFVRAKVSLDRIDRFLRETELLDNFDDGSTENNNLRQPSSCAVEADVLGIRDSSFVWSSRHSMADRAFVLRIDQELIFKRDSINVIIGPTGSGKTALLMALLGEMHFIQGGPGSFAQLPRDGGVAYAPQETWIQNMTIRDNILFGSAFDAERYDEVIYQCGLQPDLELFEAGDMTEVGERGLTLSGGQKARITLARAVYSSAKILLLDDILAALDVHTAHWVASKCFKGDLMQARTVVLVTHNLHVARSIADFVVSLGSDGRIASQGLLAEVLLIDSELTRELEQETAVLGTEVLDAPMQLPAPEIPTREKNGGTGKLVMKEEIASGRVGWQAFYLYFSSMGGRFPLTFWLLFISGMALTSSAETFQTWFLGYWAQAYETHKPSEVNVWHYISLYGAIVCVQLLVFSVARLMFVYGCLRASRTIHKRLVGSVLGTTLRWLDTTPSSRVITRCTQDIRAVDDEISSSTQRLTRMTISMLAKCTAVVIVTPTFILPSVLVALLGALLGQIYLGVKLWTKRELSNARAPVLAHLGAAIQGLPTIRAYNAQRAFVHQSYRLIDKYTRVADTSYNLNRWVGIRMEVLAAMYSAGLAAYLVYWDREGATNTGFSLNMAVGFSGMILWWIRSLNDFEVSRPDLVLRTKGNSLERIQQYIDVEQEPKPVESGVPPASWPTSGDLVVQGLSARYSEDGSDVLKGVSFSVSSGERVGIVGRTGSGKSSLVLALLRCIITEGTVKFDGLPLSDVNLNALRSHITTIPQIPELLSGTLRENLDPFSEHDDATLNDALRAAGWFSQHGPTQEASGETSAGPARTQHRLSLDDVISSGGANLSVGQRQIIALARAVVRRSKLLILDEATSAIDHETDRIIQTSLREQFGDDVTVMVVAHRLHTIMDADKVMVLDAGRLVEFASPRELLMRREGVFRSLVHESGDREKLYAIAGVRRLGS